MPKNFGSPNNTGSKYIGRHRRGRATRPAAVVAVAPLEGDEKRAEREPALVGCS